jgi:hypothetical protein
VAWIWLGRAAPAWPQRDAPEARHTAPARRGGSRGARARRPPHPSARPPGFAGGGVTPHGSLHGEVPLTPLDDELETLLAARAASIREAAPLHARYGPGGTFTEVRENLRAELAVEYRARLADYEGRVTQAMIDEAVRTDARYVALIAEAAAARERLYVLYDDVRAASARVARALAAARAGVPPEWTDSEQPDEPPG